MTTPSFSPRMSLQDFELAPLAPHRPSPIVSLIRLQCALALLGAALAHVAVAFTPALAVFELVVGMLVLSKGRRVRVGLAAGVGLHSVLAVLGFGLYTVPLAFVMFALLPYDFGPGFGRVRVQHPPEILRPAA